MAAGNLTSTGTITHLASVFYDRKALTSLRKTFMFWKGVDYRTLPLKNGKTIQFYRYSQLGANTSAATEGDYGSSLTLTSGTVSATVAQYADFISFSDMLVDTAIDNDIVAVGADQLGYRAGLSTDTIIRNEIDSVAASIDVSLLGDYFTALDGANINARFGGLDVKPFPNGYFPAIIHPYIRYDFIHDPQVGGFMDVAKQGQTDQLDRLITPNDATGFVGRFDGIEYWSSTNVKVTAGSPNTYRCYFFGQEGLAAIDLAGRGPTRTMDQDKQKFSVKVVNKLPVGVANPTGSIAALASYNFVFVAKVLDTSPYRIRKIDAPTSLGL